MQHACQFVLLNALEKCSERIGRASEHLLQTRAVRDDVLRICKLATHGADLEIDRKPGTSALPMLAWVTMQSACLQYLLASLGTKLSISFR